MADQKVVFKVSALKKGLEHFKLEPVSNKSKDLEKQLDEHLQTLELGYECPACKKDIPDVPFCPYCSESFEEEGEQSPPAEEEVVKASEESDAAPSEETAAEEKGEDTTIKDGKKGKGKGKGKDKDAAPKEPKEPKEPGKSGRPEGKSKNTEQKEAEFASLTAEIDALIGEGFEKRERKTGATYVRDSKRVFKASLMGKNLTIEFNVEIKSNVDGLVKYTEEEAKAKHLGSVTAIYTFGDSETALKLVKEALK